MNKNYVVIMLFNRDYSKLLLIKRNKKPYKGCWNGIGGKIENDETPLEAAKRECMEETGISINNPKLLLCDEPTGNLDPEKSMEIMKVLDDINKNRGTTIIMATHDKDIVNKMKKQVITLKDGHLVHYKQKGTYSDEVV